MEVFYEIDLAGVLHFMLLLNGAQRQMNAKIQLELMNIPLVKMLQEEGIQLAKEQERAADTKLDRSTFKGSNLIVGVQGYMQKNPQVMTTGETEAFLGDEGEYLAPVEDMDEVVQVMAAAGKFVDMTNFKQLLAALERLVSDIEAGKDPLDLETYWAVYGGLKSGKGRKIRSIICSSLLEYFRGNCKVLEWEENARVYE